MNVTTCRESWIPSDLCCSFVAGWMNQRASGNLLTERHWDCTKAATIASGASLDVSNSVATTYTYSANGNRQSETDPSGKLTTYIYGAFTGCVGCSDLYPTSETHGASSQLTTSYDYHFPTGLRTSVRRAI